MTFPSPLGSLQQLHSAARLGTVRSDPAMIRQTRLTRLDSAPLGQVRLCSVLLGSTGAELSKAPPRRRRGCLRASPVGLLAYWRGGPSEDAGGFLCGGGLF